MATFEFERPATDRKKLHSVAEVMDAFPDVRLVIDAREQRIERPKNKKDKDGKVQDRQSYIGKSFGCDSVDGHEVSLLQR